jgi:hypothetical protein
MLARLRAWLDRWAPIIPLLVAEFVIWLGFIVASITTGLLAEVDIVAPFYAFAAVMLISLALALFVGGPRLRGRAPAPAASAVAAV